MRNVRYHYALDYDGKRVYRCRDENQLINRTRVYASHPAVRRANTRRWTWRDRDSRDMVQVVTLP